jgi:hypothetical protein
MIGGDLNLRNGYTTLRLMWWAANLSTVVHRRLSTESTDAPGARGLH